MSLVPQSFSVSTGSTTKTLVVKGPFSFPLLYNTTIVKWDTTTGYAEIDGWYYVDSLALKTLNFNIPFHQSATPTFLIGSSSQLAPNTPNFQYGQLFVSATNALFSSTQAGMFVNYRATGYIDPTQPLENTLSFSSLGPEPGLNFTQPAGGYVFYPAYFVYVPDDIKPGTSITVVWNYQGTVSPNPTTPGFPQDWEFYWIRCPNNVPPFPNLVNPPALGVKQDYRLAGGAGAPQPTPYNATPNNQDTTETFTGIPGGTLLALGGLSYYGGAGFVGSMRITAFQYTTQYT